MGIRALRVHRVGLFAAVCLICRRFWYKGEMHPEQLFQKVLITGASVSADWSAASPGKRLGWKFGGKESVLTIARGGTPGRQMVTQLKLDAIRGRSAVIALDFLFWDSTLAPAQPSLIALKRLVELTREAGVPLILGDIPELLPGRQPSRAELNRAIREACRTEQGCFLVGLDETHRQAVSAGLEIEGRRYQLRDLVPDGLHLSETASRYLESRILAGIYGSPLPS